MKHLRTVAMAVAALVLLFSLARIGFQLWQYRENEKSYDSAAEIAGIKPSPTAPKPPEEKQDEQAEAPAAPAAPDITEQLSQIDLAALRAVNPDVLGWLAIENSGISYPILQSDDNEFYLTHDWRKNSSVAGSIFLDWRSAADFSHFNTVIYGHHMQNGAMFAELLSYRQADYLNRRRNLYLVTDAGVQRYEVYAVYEAVADGPTYQFDLTDEQARHDYLADGLAQSVVNTGVQPSAEQPVLTLSTCTGRDYRTRWVVQATRAA